MGNSNATKEIKLKRTPPDVYKILLKEQARKKISCGCQFSLEQTVYMLIRKFEKTTGRDPIQDHFGDMKPDAV